MKLFGRAFIIRQMINYAEKNRDQFETWLNENIDAPGLSNDDEGELIHELATTGLSLAKRALGDRDVEGAISKRVVLEHVARWVETVAVKFARNNKLPFISKATDDQIDTLIVGIIHDDIMPYIAARY